MSKTETGLEPQTKQVQIIRKETSSHIPVEVRQNADHRLSSIFKDNTPHKGVSSSLEKQLLPFIIDTPASADSFRKEAKDFWNALSLKVPSEGAILNLNVDEDGFPEEPKQYLTYLWAKTHPYVALTKNEMDNNAKKKFYVHDPERESANENKQVKAKAKAMKEFVKVLDDEKATIRILRVLGNSNPDKMTQEQRENALSKLMETTPKAFYEAATDTSLKIKDFIAELLSKEVLRKSGNTIFYMDEEIGATMDEAVAFIKNKKNSATVNDFRAKLQGLKEVS